MQYEVFKHPAYSPDLSPSKEAINNCMTASNDSVQEAVAQCFRRLPTELFAARTSAPAGLLSESQWLFLLNTAIYS
jgi:hypothetical protein